MQGQSYKNWIPSKEGLLKGNQLIPWENVKAVKYPASVIAGYGAIMLHYLNAKGKARIVKIPPAISAHYLGFAKSLIKHATHAAVDDALVKDLEYPLEDAKADKASLLRLILGFILTIIVANFFNAYATTAQLGLKCAITVVALMPLPVIMTIKLLKARLLAKQGGAASKKARWSTLACATPVLALLIFLSLSPFSWYWVLGDVYNKPGSLDKAQGYYVKALAIYPDSIDITYELGKLYREKEEWAQAFYYIKKAYESDPAYWQPKAVVLAPDTLMRMGQYAEALQMCEEILKNHPGKANIIAAVKNKKQEIISKRDSADRVE